MAAFNAISYNCNGLGNKSKRQKVFTYLRDKIKGKETCSIGNKHKVEGGLADRLSHKHKR